MSRMQGNLRVRFFEKYYYRQVRSISSCYDNESVNSSLLEEYIIKKMKAGIFGSTADSKSFLLEYSKKRGVLHC